jgi:hypothetical protein
MIVLESARPTAGWLGPFNRDVERPGSTSIDLSVGRRVVNRDQSHGYLVTRVACSSTSSSFSKPRSRLG